MARIAGVNIPVQKHTWVGLTHIYGIGKTRAYEICEAAGVAPETKILPSSCVCSLWCLSATEEDNVQISSSPN